VQGLYPTGRVGKNLTRREAELAESLRILRGFLFFAKKAGDAFKIRLMSLRPSRAARAGASARKCGNHAQKLVWSAKFTNVSIGQKNARLFEQPGAAEHRV
jgi:hypothetical protein